MIPQEKVQNTFEEENIPKGRTITQISLSKSPRPEKKDLSDLSAHKDTTTNRKVTLQIPKRTMHSMPSRCIDSKRRRLENLER